MFIDKLFNEDLFYRSNINALAYYTDLNDEQQIYLAVHHDAFRKLTRDGIIENLNEFDGRYCIEIWKYKPGILASNRYIDPLSVYLQFKDNTDERVELALKTLIKQQTWYQD